MRYASPVDVLLLLTLDDRVLLALRQGTGYADGEWNLPSGKLEAGEDVESALLRETAEELGLTLRRDQVSMVATVHYRNPAGAARVGFFFHPSAWQGEPVNAEPHKCAGIEWYPLNQLPPNTVPYSRAGVELFRRDESFGMQGWPGVADVVSI